MDHGTPGGYKDEGCRCDLCRSWNAARVRRQRRGEKLRHWWREYVHEAWWLATLAWEERREAAGNGWATETSEFESENPAPRFRDFLIGMAGESISPSR